MDVGPEFQRPILEAALNPEWTSDCAATAAGAEFGSVYLYEIMRNSDFVRHIARDLTDFPIDVAGASTVGKRYIQTRSGRKMSEGAAPDASSRLAMVGQLGVAVEQDSGYAKVIFDTDLNWLIR